MSSRSVVIEVWKVGFGVWKASWRKADDAFYDSRSVDEDSFLFEVDAMRRDWVIKKAEKTLQGRVDRQVRYLNQQALENKTFERVEVFLDVTKLREAEANAA